MSPELAGGFLATGSPGKSPVKLYKDVEGQTFSMD